MNKWAVALACSTVLLSACAVGPDYQPVNTVVHSQQQYGFDQAQAWVSLDQLPTTTEHAIAWNAFKDPQLNRWLEQLAEANLDLLQAQARYKQAQASLEQARAGWWPTLNTQASSQRSGSGQSAPTNQHNLNASVSWEPDVWGRVQRSVEASQAQEQASQADVAAVRLSLESTFVQSYFQAKNVLAAQQLYDQTIQAYERSLQLTQNLLQAGMVSPADVATAESQLENARTQRLALDRQAGQLRTAMAVLLGLAPADFSLQQIDSVLGYVPTVPLGVPSQLLVRRPDLVAAERRVAAANAQIGVATAAWFPSLTITAQGGYRSDSWANWLTAPARFWSLGPALALTVFDGGARRAQIREAEANYDVQAAGYKSAVLDALAEVEDQLVQGHGLQQELQSQQRVVEAAQRSLQLTQNQYEAGLVDYLAVAQTQNTLLSAERSLLSMQSELFISTAKLIAALGGSW